MHPFRHFSKLVFHYEEFVEKDTFNEIIIAHEFLSYDTKIQWDCTYNDLVIYFTSPDLVSQPQRAFCTQVYGRPRSIAKMAIEIFYLYYV